MISVIIPTHDPKYLSEAIESVLRQTYQDFEIVVVPNGPCPDFSVPQSDKIRVVSYRDKMAVLSVGRVKKFAFAQAHGDILLELDHDDLLSPDCLEQVAGAFSDPQVDFVYSNFAEMADGAARPGDYDKSLGWETRSAQLLGMKLRETVAFPPSPASFSKIFFAPNHVRAWRRSFYEGLGGHNDGLKVCDDLELLMRTYQKAKKISHIDRCLYVYRLHDGNTILKNQDEIISTNWMLYTQNIEGLVQKWARDQGLRTVTIGPGPRGEWEALDPEIDGFSHENDTMGAIKAHDCLQRYSGKTYIMIHLYRSLAPGGWLLSSTPAATGQGGFLDPKAISYWTKSSFYPFTERRFQKQFLPESAVRFQPQRLDEAYPSNWHKENQMHYVNFDALALKEGYDGPGPRTI